MPTYVYNVLDKDGRPTGEQWETFQRMSEDALTRHPDSGKPIARAVVPVHVPGTELHGKTQTLTDMQCQPFEVGQVRELYGNLGHVVQPDGSFKVKSRQEARDLYRREAKIKERFSDLKAAGKLGPTKKERREAAKAAKPAAR